MQRLLQIEKSRFAAAPILLIESRTLQKEQQSEQVEVACRRINFLLSQQLGFHTATSHSSGDYAFSTVFDINHQVDLALRVGASTVCAVGAGSAIDLAKATVQNGNFDELLLVPATYSAMLAAASSHSLLLDTIEEELVVRPSQSETLKQVPTAVTLLNENMIDPGRRKDALYASLALLLDRLHRQGDVLQVQAMVDTAVACLAQQSSPKEHDALSKLLLNVGEEISYGLESENRSIPLAIAASLIKDFPQHSIVTVMASLAPAMSQLVGEIVNIPAEILDQAPKILTTESLETLLSRVHTNQSLWNSLDASDRVFSQILKDFVLVSS